MTQFKNKGCDAARSTPPGAEVHAELRLISECSRMSRMGYLVDQMWSTSLMVCSSSAH